MILDFTLSEAARLGFRTLQPKLKLTTIGRTLSIVLGELVCAYCGAAYNRNSHGRSQVVADPS